MKTQLLLSDHFQNNGWCRVGSRLPAGSFLPDGKSEFERALFLRVGVRIVVGSPVSDSGELMDGSCRMDFSFGAGFDITANRKIDFSQPLTLFQDHTSRSLALNCGSFACPVRNRFQHIQWQSRLVWSVIFLSHCPPYTVRLPLFPCLSTREFCIRP